MSAALDGARAPAERRLITVRGVVQGVGFRPFVYRLARELALAGSVANDADGVAIDVQGAATRLEEFTARLLREAPPGARVDGLAAASSPAIAGRAGFTIAASQAGPVHALAAPDAAVCEACLDELFDPASRRYRHPFIACSDCGPRYTLLDALPFDRARTAMAPFPLCARCRAEYADPADRRFHAEIIACPDCGPRLHALDHEGRVRAGDPIALAQAALAAGQIVAVKGVGGFHLACAAGDAAAVARLRAGKARAGRPFALMVANCASAAQWVCIDEATRALLESRARPIVIARRRACTADAFAGVAPDLDELGLLLPYTPVHWLLMHAAAGAPSGTAWRAAAQQAVFVMTSANASGEPLVRDDDEAGARLRGIADLLLTHDRAIRVRCDDSVVRPVRAPGHGARYLRRGRGHAPGVFALDRSGPPVLALGGALKVTLCLTRERTAIMSGHVGDLATVAGRRALGDTLEHLTRLTGIAPALIAHDLHPDYPTSLLAAQYAAVRGVPCVAVQHHHAHIAAVAAEHGFSAEVLGLALDGSGYGSDGTPWGGELLRVHGAHSTRIGHLRPLCLPGGDGAAREPWRMAASALHELGRGAEISRRFPDRRQAAALQRLLAQGTFRTRTSSAGRWFDAASALLGVATASRYEGEAALRLEQSAQRHGPVQPQEGLCGISDDGVLDLLPLIDLLADERDPARGAAVFHATFAAALTDWVAVAAARTGLRTVALGGGCCVNRTLVDLLVAGLAGRGLRVLEARDLPPGDGAISLGQAWVAQRTLPA